MKVKFDLSQPSTKKGLVLLGSVAAVALGHPELITATVTESGEIQMGGLIGMVVTGVIGLLDVIRDDSK